MKFRRIAAVLTMTIAMAMSSVLAVSAESQTVNGHCYFNGEDIISDFSNDTVADSISGLEPGDDVTFKVEFRNAYDVTTHWYMRNEVLTTLEESYDRSENGGYTYILTHIRPDGTRQVLFDNSEVGGNSFSDGNSGDLEGLHQATNATDQLFFIQTLEPDSKPAYTELYVKFDGETEVNDYMDTYGKLMVAYAVELEEEGSKTYTTTSTKKTKTGDATNLLVPLASMVAAALLLILALISHRGDRKTAAAQAASGKERE